jgi:nucleoside-diphosphate-sugar epimerase
MATWLITGATGFLGRHVLDALPLALAREGRFDDRVMVLGRRPPSGWPNESFVSADFDDFDRLRQAFRELAPDYVIHTAGRTPPASDEELYRANFWSAIRLLNVLRSLKSSARVVLSGSAAELGPVATADLPVDESYECRPADAYGRSKWLATIAGLAERPPLEVVIARVFNPIGPGMPSTQAFGEFAAQLRVQTTEGNSTSSARQAQDPLAVWVGDLQTRRDFIDVRDVARALVALSLKGHGSTVYHVGTGQSRSIAEGLELLVQHFGRSIRVCPDPSRTSRRGPSDSRAKITRIVEHTGWEPTIPFEQSIADLWNDGMTQRTSNSSNGLATLLPLTA